MLVTLLQSSPGRDIPVLKIILLSLGILAAVTVGLLVVQRIKKQLQTDDDVAGKLTGGFTLSDLRQLHKAGEMSDEEFEKAKAKIIDAAKRAAERDLGGKAQDKTGEPPVI
jgi:hypothetical protein